MRIIVKKLLYSLIILFLTTLSVSGVKAATDGSTDYGYQQLDSSGKQIYSAIREAVNSFISSEKYNSDYSSTGRQIASLTVDSSCSNEDIRHAYNVFYYDNPQYYWLAKSATISSSSKKELRINIDSQYFTASSRRAADAAINTTASEWINELTPLFDESPDDEDKYLVALRLHDLIISRINYLYDNGSPSLKCSAHSIAGVLDGSGAVCEGYARTYQYILNLLDIDNVYVTGYSRSEGHAWNAVALDGEYYCVDTTWDDGNNNSYLIKYDNRLYDYFCTPYSTFSKDHQADDNVYVYPAFSDNDTYCYYRKYRSISDTELDTASAEILISSALANCHGDYVYFQVPTKESIKTLVKKLGLSGSYSYISSVYGYLYILENIVVNNPASSLGLYLDKESAPLEDGIEIPLELNESISFEALLTATAGECDDRAAWTVEGNTANVSLSPDGSICKVKALRNGVVTLTVTAFRGTDGEGAKLSKSVKLILGTGIYTPLYTLYAGGSRETKAVTVKPSITASSWRDSKGKIKQGKLVWIVLNEQTAISFNETKHTVNTKSSKELATVNSKGVVSAKKPGMVYVYCCDTGSMSYECFDVEILQAPAKLLISSEAGSTEKKDLLKKSYIDVGTTAQAFIIPVLKESGTDTGNTYKISYAKPEDSKYLSFTQPDRDSEGNISFTVTGLNFDTAKGKPSSVRLVISNVQSGKKTTLNVSVTNPVKSVRGSFSSYSLEHKNDTVTIKLSAMTAAGREIPSTDSVKVYVAGNSVSLNNGRIVKDGRTSVKAKYDKKTNSILLTASKDAGLPAEVAIVYIHAVSREALLVKVCTVDEGGKIVSPFE